MTDVSDDPPRDGTSTAPRCVVALNPHSRNGDSSEKNLLDALATAGFDIVGGRPCSTDDLGDWLERHGPEMRAGSDRIIVGGGDGTINYVLPTLVGAPVPVAIIPLGTANDLALTLGLPDEIDAAVQVAREGHAERIDVGRINDRLFTNVASMGVGPTVTKKLTSDLKARLGVLSYPKALIDAYREMRPFRCRIRVDGGRETRLRANHLAVGSGRHYGGGATVHEDASIVDGRLDLYALSPMPLWKLLLLGPWLKYGRHRDLETVSTLHGTRMRIRTSRRLEISADGEIVTETPAIVEVMPRALTVMVPDGSPVRDR